MLNLEATDQYYQQQQQIAATTVASAKKLWRGMDDDLDRSWSDVAPAMLDTVQLGRTAAAVSSLAVLPLTLDETGQRAAGIGEVSPAAFIATAPDGRSMGSLIGESVVKTKTAIARGAAVSAALSIGEQWMTGMLLTVLADTGRGVVSADIAQRPQVAGYIRMLNPPSCSRCVILAGRWFRWNDGFLRHPRCDCRHIPATDEAWASSEGFISDPYEYFRSLPPAEQDRIWGKNGASAIRDGADIYRVENVRMRGLATAKGNLRYGTPSKMTVDDIYATARNRDEAMMLLQREGYITGPQTPGGNILGPRAERFSKPISRPVVAGSARDRVLQARASGVRDPLDRATMTAAERRLFDANYRLEYARQNGYVPRSIGANSADDAAGAIGTRATPAVIARLEASLARQLAQVTDRQASMLRLVDALGLNDGRTDVVFERTFQQMRSRLPRAARRR